MRPRYHDLAPGDFGEQLAPYDFVELKYDGLYAEFVGGPHGWAITGRNDALLRYGDEPCPDCYLRGEFIDGTEWARGSELFGLFMAWDCIHAHGVLPADYNHSRELISSIVEPFNFDGPIGGGLNYTGLWGLPMAESVWKSHVIRDGYEGLVFRSADGQRYGRMKRVVTQDYVCTGVRRKGPVVDALFGGLYINGDLETVCTVPVKAAAARARVGAMSSCYGLVFEAAGNAVLKSGALRHPRQAGTEGSVRWRTDKAARECRL